MKNKKPSKRTILILLIFGLAIFLSRKSLFGNIANSQTAPTVSFEMQSSQGSETSTSVPLKVKLSASSTQTIKVDYQTTAGTASPIDEGTGQDYQPLRGTLTLNPGETEKNITLNIINDTINETDETVVIALSNPQSATLGANSAYTYTIADDDRAVLASVKDYGAKGDGQTDDTAAIQAAVDDVFQKGGGSTGKGGVLIFPAGTYIVKSVSIKDNITYEGYGATIKRPEHLTDQIGQAAAKWVRAFTNGPSYYSGDTDSKPLIVRGLTFNGSSQTQGSYKNYELEQAAMLFLTGRDESQGRLKAYVEDCFFKDGVGDAIAAHRHMDITVYNVTAKDVFRGGFVSSGDNNADNRVHIKNLTTMGNVDPTGIDFEGYDDANGTKPSEIYLNDLFLKDGDFDIGVESGTQVSGNNILTDAPTLLYADGVNMHFSNSKFGVDGNMIYYPSQAVFDSCEFYVSEKDTPEQDRTLNAAPMLEWNTNWATGKNQSITFNNCRFSVASNIEPGDTTYGIYTGWDDMDYNNILNVNGGYISKDFDVGIGTMFRGGNWKIKNIFLDAALPFSWIGYRDGSGNNSSMNISLDGIAVGQNSKYMHITGYNSTYGISTENKLDQKNIQIDEANNVITTNYGLEGNSYSGSRLILGTNPPTSSANCLTGDIYRLKNPISGQAHEWLCIDPGYDTNPSSWSPLPVLPVIAALSNMPVSPAAQNSAVINVSGMGVASFKYKVDNGNWSAETSVNTPINLSNLANGSHTLAVMGKNSAGVWQDDTRPTTWTWLIDKDTLPPNGNVLINNGENIADSNNVTLNLNAFDVSNNSISKMRISNVPDFNTAQEYDYATSKSWTLNPGKGIQPVYVWFKDSLGNWTPAGSPHIDTIYSTFEGSPPVITADLNSDNLVNQLDFSILKTDFLKLTASLANPKSDIDGDGQATIKDVGIMMSGWK